MDGKIDRDTIGPYRIVEELGRGGMGVVYVAEDERLGRRVALKTLNPGAEHEHARLWREARAAAALNHPGICQVYDVEEEDGELWIAMELLEGDGLDKTLERERLTVDQAVRVGLDILEPLGYLHDRGLVHRDLKPSNIFLTPVGLKLLDFGLTCGFDETIDPLGSDARLTQTGTILGTPRYMAPEQWRARDVGPQSDIFSWGAIAYEMLSGRHAFEGEDAIDIFHACAKEQPPPLTGAPGIEILDRVVRGALAKEPEGRYASARELAKALRGAHERLRALETTGSRGRSATLEAETARRFIALPFRVLRPDPDIDFLATSLPEAIGTSLSGLKHLVVRSTQLGAGHDTALDLKKLAAEVEVDYALSGTLMRGGPQVRVNAQLLQVPAGTVLWSLQEDAPVDDLFRLHDELTHRIVEGVQLPLSPAEEARLGREQPVNARAFELYLRGVHLVSEVRSGADLLSIRDLLKEAVESDPEFAPAWAMYGRACRVIAKYLREDVETHKTLAKEAFERAFEIDPDSPITHNLFTYYQLEELGDSKGAMLRLMDRVAQGSTDADVWAGLVPACRFLGLYEASLAAHARAAALDPKIETSVLHTHIQLGHYDVIIQSETLPMLRASALAAAGNEAEAVALMESSEGVEFEGVRRHFMGSMLAAIRGQVDECEALVREALELGIWDPEAAFFFARVAGRAGLTDLAMEIMSTRAVDRGFFAVSPLAIDPWLEGIRREPGFPALMARAREGRRDALEAFRAVRGEKLLGVEEASA